MGIVDSALESVKRNVTEIEKRTDINDDQKVAQIIKVFSATCAGVAVQPIPFADFFVLTPIQAYMGTRIAAIRGVPVSRTQVETVIKEIAGVVGLGLLAQQLAIGAYKTFIPFLGAITTIPMVFGLTYGIGQIIDAYFMKKAKGESLSKIELKRMWKTALKEGTEIGKNEEGAIADRAKQDTGSGKE